MGKAICAAAKNDCTIVAGIDINASALSAASSFPIYEKISDFPDKADVIIDFSHHSALPSLIEYAKATKTPIVIATTGHTEEELALIEESAKEIAIFRSGNFSLGINLLITLAKQAARTLGTDFDVEIVVDVISVAGTLYNRLLDSHVLAKGNRGFTRQTDYRKAIGAVGGDFKLNGGIAKHQNIADIVTQTVFAICIQNQNAVCFLAGHIMLGELQFAHRAEHTVGFNAAQLARLDDNVTGELCNGERCGNECANKNVLRTGNDLNVVSEFFARIYLADPHVVGVGVFFHCGYLCNHNVFNVLAQNLKAFDLRSGNGQLVCIFFIRDFVGVDEIGKPIS